MAHADGAAQEAGSLAEVARGHVGDVVVAAELLAGAGGRGARRRATHHAVGAASLVHHARLRPRAHHVRARLCGRRATASQGRRGDRDPAHKPESALRPCPSVFSRSHTLSMCPAHTPGSTSKTLPPGRAGSPAPSAPTSPSLSHALTPLTPRELSNPTFQSSTRLFFILHPTKDPIRRHSGLRALLDSAHYLATRSRPPQAPPREVRANTSQALGPGGPALPSGPAHTYCGSAPGT